MLLKNLHIINFKMFEDLNLQFKPGFNLILGDNGVGKTSVLEAATVAVSGFLTGMEDIPTRNIYNIQFIAATHSPIIVSSCKDANIINLDENGNVRYITDSYAFSVNDILRDMLGYHMRPAKVENLIEEFEKRMDREEYDDAKKALDQLIVILGEKHPQSIALKSEYKIEAEE